MREEKTADCPVRAGQIYRHFKGNWYCVEGVARHTETDEPMVIYRVLYGDGMLWARPLPMFLSPVDREKYPNSAQTQRFAPVGTLEAAPGRLQLCGLQNETLGQAEWTGGEELRVWVAPALRGSGLDDALRFAAQRRRGQAPD